MSAIIKVENLGKRYVIRHGKGSTYSTLRESINNGVRGVGRFLTGKGFSPDTREDLWALKDVDFEVEPGAKVGIIGRNGAGKSTLLKILSRITEPSTGCARLNGRVGSLLEVGTGFHPELTGGENIFLNGALLGMKRFEIKKKFDEIVDFAGIEKFLDTPVKRYSSGMYVRLGFAVAAHLEPEILLVDEVLAVGDADFQKKCLGKMGEIARQGRTILFVSHNMNSIEQLCGYGILLNDGTIETQSADVSGVIRQYLFRNRDVDDPVCWHNQNREYENPYFDAHSFALVDAGGTFLKLPVRNDSDMVIEIKGTVKEAHPALCVGYAVYTEDNLRVYSSLVTDEPGYEAAGLPLGPVTFQTVIPKRFLNEGGYRISLIMGIRTRTWYIHPNQSAPNLSLEIKGGLSDSIYWTIRRSGVIGPLLHWDVHYEERTNS